MGYRNAASQSQRTVLIVASLVRRLVHLTCNSSWDLNHCPTLPRCGRSDGYGVKHSSVERLISHRIIFVRAPISGTRPRQNQGKPAPFSQLSVDIWRTS